MQRFPFPRQKGQHGRTSGFLLILLRDFGNSEGTDTYFHLQNQKPLSPSTQDMQERLWQKKSLANILQFCDKEHDAICMFRAEHMRFWYKV